MSNTLIIRLMPLISAIYPHLVRDKDVTGQKDRPMCGVMLVLVLHSSKGCCHLQNLLLHD